MFYELTILIIGRIYPAFATYSCLTGNQQSQLSWLKYWVVFAIFMAFHFISGYLESWLPFIGGFKLCLLFWLLPTFGGGSQLIYDEFVDPLMTRNEATIQEAFKVVSDVTSAFLRELIKMIYYFLVDVVEQCQLILNGDDFHVTPRLQAAVNHVIAEQRTVRQGIRDPRPDSHPQVQGQVGLPENDLNRIRNSKDSTLTADDLQLRILQAEAASAMKMLMSMLSAKQEHLAPIRPLEPRNNNNNSKKVLEWEQKKDMVYLDSIYGEYQT